MMIDGWSEDSYGQSPTATDGEGCMLNQTQHTEGDVLVCTVAILAHNRRNSVLSSAFMQ